MLLYLFLCQLFSTSRSAADAAFAKAAATASAAPAAAAKWPVSPRTTG